MITLTITDKKQIKQLSNLLKQHSENVGELFKLAHLLNTDAESLKKSIMSLTRYSNTLEQEAGQ